MLFNDLTHAARPPHWMTLWTLISVTWLQASLWRGPWWRVAPVATRNPFLSASVTIAIRIKSGRRDVAGWLDPVCALAVVRACVQSVDLCESAAIVSSWVVTIQLCDAQRPTQRKSRLDNSKCFVLCVTCMSHVSSNYQSCCGYLHVSYMYNCICTYKIGLQSTRNSFS